MPQYAEDRSCITQFELAQMFQQVNSSRNFKVAVKWYMRSAKKGYRRAQHRLGAMYARGSGVSRNYVKAYAWCQVSASQHSRRALLKLKIIEQHMSTDQIDCARKLSKQYFQMYVAPFAH